MNYSLHTKNKGFTIIETLVAITVLMIAIVGPLSVAARGLTSALFSKDQMVASYLAQESMETIKNLRDNNVAASTTWITAPTIGTLSVCTSGQTSRCDADVLEGFVTCPTTYCPLYFSTGTGYVHGSGTATPFSRSFYLEAISSTEYRVHVLVTWKEGSIPNQLDLQSELVNTIR